MLISMTGFSTKTITITRDNAEALEIILMLKSLNAKFLEVNARLPFPLTHLETEIIKHFKAKLIRGTLYLTIQVTNPGALKAELEPAYTIVESYLKTLNKIQEKFKIPGTITISDLLALPHIFEFPEMLIDDQTSALVLKAVDDLAEELMKTRSAEGTSLEKDLMARIKRIHENMVDLEKAAAESAQQRKDQMFATFEAAMAQEPSENRDAQLQLLNAQLVRYEINEEVVRFKSHLANLEKTITSPEFEKGKKLDFTIQELFREINTLGSKAGSAEVGSLAISIKLELEKIREQVQNIL